MKIKHSVQAAFKALKAHKSRSALTILGIVIGISSIITVMALGQSAQDLILNQVRGLGSQTIIIEAGKEPSGPSDMAEIYTDSLKERDIFVLENPQKVKGVLRVSPMSLQTMPITYEEETVRNSVLGTTGEIASILDIYPSEGENITEDDVKEKANVVIVGSSLKKKLFGESDAMGEKIKIKGKTFRVGGILKPKGQIGMLDVDNIAIIPYTTAMQYLTGVNYFHAIFVQAETEGMVPMVVSDITYALRDSHGIVDSSKDDFHVVTQAVAAESVGVIMGVLTALLGAVAGISLVVGGIGIMNIMLVSVTERTREIGLRKALGATEKDILRQFLYEAVILTATGGIVGIFLGTVFSIGVTQALNVLVSSGWTFSFPILGSVLGVGVSVAVGLLFGIYPAKQASEKSPMEALRYE